MSKAQVIVPGPQAGKEKASDATAAEDYARVMEIYEGYKAERTEHVPLWKDISRYSGIGVDPDYIYIGGKGDKSEDLDSYVDDPTAAISVNQAGDYLAGIMWGTGEGVLDLVPSHYVTDLVDKDAVAAFYKYASTQLLYHMNHADAGYATKLKPYAYEQVSHGTSGIGTFKNDGYVDGREENALIFRNYGVDNMCIGEGKSGNVDYVFCTYHWRVARIIGEFAADGKMDKLPKVIRDAYAAGDINKEFEIVFGVMPRDDYDPKLKGKKGTRYRGVWFLEDGGGDQNGFFYEEDFKERPISPARMILMRGDAWGRSSGTMLMSSIKSTNFMLGTAIEVIEKMSNPSIGLFSNAIFGDSVLDTSPDGLTVFNSAASAPGSQSPAFPLYDVGDPSALIKILIPYMEEKIATAFKVDILLDFSSQKEITATQSTQQFIIRGKALSGMLTQQKNERLIPDVKASANILQEMGLLGVDARVSKERADRLRGAGREDRIIPPEVLEVMESGRPWFDIKFNNELEKLTRTESIENAVTLVNAVLTIAAAKPEIIHSIDWYKLVSDINKNLDQNSGYVISETKFKEEIERIAQQQASAMAMQAGQAAATASKDAAMADKSKAEADSVRRQ